MTLNSLLDGRLQSQFLSPTQHGYATRLESVNDYALYH